MFLQEPSRCSDGLLVQSKLLNGIFRDDYFEQDIGIKLYPQLLDLQGELISIDFYVRTKSMLALWLVSMVYCASELVEKSSESFNSIV